jgi:amine acid ABC transporter, permease protein, 3-TM region, His/Glu/Gln/Arg/opine family
LKCCFTYSRGLQLTTLLYFVTIILSIPLGLLFAFCATGKNIILKKIIAFYTWIFRGTPLLQLFFVYYGLPVLGIKLTAFGAASLTFAVNYAAYLTEIFRGGIESIDEGQYEASYVLGLNYIQTMKNIVLPQAIKNVLPSLGNEAITLIKDTALISAIGMAEILRNSKDLLPTNFLLYPLYYVLSYIWD